MERTWRAMFPLGTRILIRQTPAAHVEIQELIEGMRPHKGSNGRANRPVEFGWLLLNRTWRRQHLHGYGVASSSWAIGLFQQLRSAELHPQSADFVGVDLVLRCHRLAVNSTSTA